MADTPDKMTLDEAGLALRSAAREYRALRRLSEALDMIDEIKAVVGQADARKAAAEKLAADAEAKASADIAGSNQRMEAARQGLNKVEKTYAGNRAAMESDAATRQDKLKAHIADLIARDGDLEQHYQSKLKQYTSELTRAETTHRETMKQHQTELAALMTKISGLRSEMEQLRQRLVV